MPEAHHEASFVDGAGGGDVKLVANAANTVCYDNSTMATSATTASDCSSKTVLLTVDTFVQGPPTTFKATPGSGITLDTEGGMRLIAEGHLTGSGGTPGTVIVDANAGYCGDITGDFRPEHEECRRKDHSWTSAGTPKTLLSYNGSNFSVTSPTTVVKGQGVYASGSFQSNFMGMGDVVVCTGALSGGSCPSTEKEFRINIDRMMMGSQTEVKVRVEQQSSASLNTLGNRNRFKVADAGGGQPVDFEVNFVKYKSNGAHEVKLRTFMPPPQLVLPVNTTLPIDGVNVISRDGNQQITFDNSTLSSARDMQSHQSVTLGSAINLAGIPNSRYAITIKDTSRNYEIGINNQSGTFNVEFFEMAVGGGGAAVGPGAHGQSKNLVAGKMLCVEHANATNVVDISTGCTSPKVELLRIASGTAVLTLGSGWTVTQNDPNYALSSATPPVRTLTANDKLGRYKLKHSTKGELELETDDPRFHSNGSLKELRVMVMPAGMHQGGGPGPAPHQGTDGGGGAVSKAISLPSAYCPSGHSCEVKNDHSNPRLKYQVASSSHWMHVSVEYFKHLPGGHGATQTKSLTDIRQHGSGQGGPPPEGGWTCTSNSAVQTISFNLAGQTGRTALVRENCTASYASSTAMWIAYLDGNNYIQFVFSDVGTLTALQNSDTWPSVLANIQAQ